MLVVFAPQVPLYGIGIVLAGVLQAHRRFLAPALAPLLVQPRRDRPPTSSTASSREAASCPEAVVATAAVLVLAGGTTLGVVVLSLPAVRPGLRAGARLRPTLRFPEGTARGSAPSPGPACVALLAQQAAVLVTLWLANNRGSQRRRQRLPYVQAVYLLPYAVLAVPVATSAFPALAARARATGRRQHGTLARSLQAILLLCGGAAARARRRRPPRRHVLPGARPRRRAPGRGRRPGRAPRRRWSPTHRAWSASAPRPCSPARSTCAGRPPWPRSPSPAGGWWRRCGRSSRCPTTRVPPAPCAASVSASSRRHDAVGASPSPCSCAAPGAWRPHGAPGAPSVRSSVAAAVSAGVGDVLAFYWSPTAAWPAQSSRAWSSRALVAVLYLAVMFAADRGAMQAALQRGRRRRGGDA